MRPQTIVSAGMLLLGSAAFAGGEELLANWPSPPYWTPPAAREARTALAVSTPLPFVALTPCRIIDTRGNAPLTGGFLPSATVRSYTVTNVCGIPANAQALSLNATVVHPTGPGFLTLWPEGGAFPPVSTLNYLGNDVIVNAAVVPLSGTGGISMALGVSGGDVILDTNGYYASQTVVTTLNGVSGDVTLAAGTNVTITPAGSTLTIAATGGGGGAPSGPAGGGLSGTYPNPTVVSTTANTPNSIVSRDGSGSFSVNHLDLGGSLTLSRPCGTGPVVWMSDGPFLTVDNCQQNTYTGSHAGQPNSPGSQNSAYGSYALDAITAGNYNSAFGAFALLFNTAGSYNSAFGLNALRNNTTGSHNTAIGPDTLSAQSFGNAGVEWGGFNTAVGTGALATNNPTTTSNGVQNTAVGAYSLRYNTFGRYHTAVGVNAGSISRLVPGYNFGSTVLLQLMVGGDSNTLIGHEAGATGMAISNCTAVGAHAYCDGDDQVRLGNADVLSIGGRTPWSALSDARAKRDIRDLDLGLDFVLRLRPVAYTLKIGNGRRDLGFLAQDVERLLGEDYNVVTVGGDPARTLSLRYTDLIAPVVRAIQEQEMRHRSEVEIRDARIAELERRLAVLEERATAAESRR